jgi:GNAT superfamily N-acetyltransferase
MQIQIRELESHDAEMISSAFQEIGWDKPTEQYLRYFSEQEDKKRLVLVALVDHNFAGYVTVVWQSDYPPFKEKGIPEVVDLNVLPQFQHKKVGSTLMDHAEEIIKQQHDIVGIGVGLAPGYSAAQQMYVRRGYIPDGLGVTYDNRFVEFGEQVTVDDSLVLHLTKKLR